MHDQHEFNDGGCWFRRPKVRELGGQGSGTPLLDEKRLLLYYLPCYIFIWLDNTRTCIDVPNHEILLGYQSSQHEPTRIDAS